MIRDRIERRVEREEHHVRILARGLREVGRIELDLAILAPTDDVDLAPLVLELGDDVLDDRILLACLGSHWFPRVIR